MPQSAAKKPIFPAEKPEADEADDTLINVEIVFRNGSKRQYAHCSYGMQDGFLVFKRGENDLLAVNPDTVETMEISPDA